MTGSRHKPADVQDVDLSQFQCGTYSVPLDYTKPTGDQVKIAVVKWPASGVKQGSLLTNPGGPGASGVDFVEGAQSQGQFDDTLHSKFDIIGFHGAGPAVRGFPSRWVSTLSASAISRLARLAPRQ